MIKYKYKRKIKEVIMLKIEHVDVLFLESDTPRDKKEREHLAGINLVRI